MHTNVPSENSRKAAYLFKPANTQKLTSAALRKVIARFDAPCTVLVSCCSRWGSGRSSGHASEGRRASLSLGTEAPASTFEVV